MAGITTALCLSYLVELLKGVHDHTTTTGDVFKCALFKANASITGTYGASTTNYSDMTGNSDELPASGNYSTGGFAWTAAQNVTPSLDSTTVITDWSVDPSWANATFTTRGCMIYNSSASNAAMGVINFGADKTVAAGTFTITLPVAAAATAIFRLNAV